MCVLCVCVCVYTAFHHVPQARRATRLKFLIQITVPMIFHANVYICTEAGTQAGWSPIERVFLAHTEPLLQFLAPPQHCINGEWVVHRYNPSTRESGTIGQGHPSFYIYTEFRASLDLVSKTKILLGVGGTHL